MRLRQRRHLRTARLCAGLCLAVVAVTSLAACSSGHSHRGAAGPAVRVTERDFRISVAPARVHSGDVRLLVRNRGPDTHELIVVRAHGLPLRTDGLTVNEEALATVGSVEGQAPGHVHEVRLHLKPGRYELFCNMAGHYLGGMRAVLVVT